jgi:hypothetical protein
VLAKDWLGRVRDGRRVSDWDPQPTRWRGLAAVRVEEIPLPGPWVQNDQRVLRDFVRLARLHTSAADVAAFVRRWDRIDNPIQQDDRFRMASPWRSAAAPPTVIVVRDYQRQAAFVEATLKLGRALREFRERGAAERWTWEAFSSAQGAPAARATLDMTGGWQWAQGEAARLRAWRVEGHKWEGDTPWLPDAIALRSATEICFGIARIEMRLVFDWLEPIPRGIEYRIIDTWQAICMALAHELVEPGRGRVCRKCYRPYQPKRRRGRPALLCPRCFTAAEGRRVSAQLYYENKKRKASQPVVSRVRRAAPAVSGSPGLRSR